MSFRGGIVFHISSVSVLFCFVFVFVFMALVMDGWMEGNCVCVYMCVCLMDNGGLERRRGGGIGVG